MPVKSEKQRRFMQACIHNPKKMKGECPTPSQAKRVLGKHASVLVYGFRDELRKTVYVNAMNIN